MSSLLQSSLYFLWFFGTVLVADDFWYKDFNSTVGLRFNGVAGTSSCDDGAQYAYSVLHGINDEQFDATVDPVIIDGRGTTESVVTSSTVDALGSSMRETTQFYADFPHRFVVGPSPSSTCPVRIRLTPSRPNRAGSLMRLQAQPLLNGFEVGFTFQVTDASRACTLVKGRDFDTRSYQSCSIHAGDGFAFVLHADGNASAALGSGAEGLGYAGLSNALVVEFDAFPNLGPGTGDLLDDHVSVQVPPQWGGLTCATEACTIVRSRRLTGSGDRSGLKGFSDGLPHRARIVYERSLRYDLAAYFSATPNLARLQQDLGEGRRMGTLAVYVDDMTTPLIVAPMNLNAALDIPENQAYMGFTAATGTSWAKFDVMDWYACEQPGCPLLLADPSYLLYYPLQ